MLLRIASMLGILSCCFSAFPAEVAIRGWLGIEISIWEGNSGTELHIEPDAFMRASKTSIDISLTTISVPRKDTIAGAMALFIRALKDPNVGAFSDFANLRNSPEIFLESYRMRWSKVLESDDVILESVYEAGGYSLAVIRANIEGQEYRRGECLYLDIDGNFKIFSPEGFFGTGSYLALALASAGRDGAIRFLTELPDSTMTVLPWPSSEQRLEQDGSGTEIALKVKDIPKAYSTIYVSEDFVPCVLPSETDSWRVAKFVAEYIFLLSKVNPVEGLQASPEWKSLLQLHWRDDLDDARTAWLMARVSQEKSLLTKDLELVAVLDLYPLWIVVVRNPRSKYTSLHHVLEENDQFRIVDSFGYASQEYEYILSTVWLEQVIELFPKD